MLWYQVHLWALNVLVASVRFVRGLTVQRHCGTGGPAHDQGSLYHFLPLSAGPPRTRGWTLGHPRQSSLWREAGVRIRARRVRT